MGLPPLGLAPRTLNVVIYSGPVSRRPQVRFGSFVSMTLRGGAPPMSAMPGGLNRSAQHSNLLAEMECEHEAATSHLLFFGSAV